MQIENLTKEERKLMVQRLAALWAFSESGLGGVLHALQIPFTGLVVGGFAIILISFISYLSQDDQKQIFKSLMVVLLVKAAVSPHTPFPAYIAVSFQATLGYLLFKLFRINLFSITLLSIIAMIESAIQKLLMLVLFFGKSFLKAGDELVKFIGGQFSVNITNGGWWMVALYMCIYIIGGVIIAITTYRLINASFDTTALSYEAAPNNFTAGKQGNRRKKIWFLLITSLFISLLLVAFQRQKIALPVIAALTWTITAILAWYFVIGPLFTKLVISLLKKNSSKYGAQVQNTLSFLPVLHQLTVQAWHSSKKESKAKRILVFIKTLLGWSLLYKEPSSDQ